jgi:hypothetical protein
MQVSDRLYRLIDEHQRSFGVSLDGEWTASRWKRVNLRWEIWQVEKVTPKGYWVVQTGAFWHGTKEPELRHVSEVRLTGGRR